MTALAPSLRPGTSSRPSPALSPGRAAAVPGASSEPVQGCPPASSPAVACQPRRGFLATRIPTEGPGYCAPDFAVDPVAVRRMTADGMSSSAIADALGVPFVAVVEAAFLARLTLSAAPQRGRMPHDLRARVAGAAARAQLGAA